MTEFRVEGTKDVIRAFEQVGRDVQKGSLGVVGAEAMLDDVAHFTRQDTGSMAEGWGVEEVDGGGAFTNLQFYWTFQEFGTEDIEPMDAIGTAWRRAEKQVVSAMSDEIEQIGEDAGFPRKGGL